MHKIRPHSTMRPQIRKLVEVNAQGFNIPLEKNWSDHWCTLPAKVQTLYDEIYNFQVYDDDIFLVTFPKSGTTWIQEAAWLLLNDLNFEKASEVNLSRRSVFMEFSVFKENLPVNTIELAANLPRPRMIKSHLPAFLLPQQIWTKKTKIIYCGRNPKDVSVSYYHFHKDLRFWEGSIENFINDFMNKDIVYTPYWPHILDFWQMRHQPQIFFTTYETMKNNLAEVIIKLNEFLGKPTLSDENLKKLLNHLSFDKMKDNLRTNPTEHIKTIFQDASENFQFMRRGITGAYRDELTMEMQQKLDEWTAKNLAAYNLKENEIFGDSIKKI